jgi:hypothetical protein
MEGSEWERYTRGLMFQFLTCPMLHSTNANQKDFFF